MPMNTPDDQVLVEFIDDEKPYLTWLVANRNGYVLNVPKSGAGSSLMMHVATCETIQGVPPAGGSWTKGAYMKVCSTNRKAITQWVKDRYGTRPERCGTCSS